MSPSTALSGLMVAILVGGTLILAVALRLGFAIAASWRSPSPAPGDAPGLGAPAAPPARFADDGATIGSPWDAGGFVADPTCHDLGAHCGDGGMDPGCDGGGADGSCD